MRVGSQDESRSSLSAKEQELLAATVGVERYRVLSRWPLTIAVAPLAFLPGAGAGLVAFAMASLSGLTAALVAAAVATTALTLSLAVHEGGHLLASLRADGVEPRLLLLRATGGVAIVEGRFENPRGAALFAAGGPVASIAATAIFLGCGWLSPSGGFRTGILLAAFLNLLLLAVNLLPVAPMDGFALLRAAVWARSGDRPSAERRAFDLSRVILTVAAIASLLVVPVDRLTGLLMLFLVATLILQHRLAARRLLPPGKRGWGPGTVLRGK